MTDLVTPPKAVDMAEGMGNSSHCCRKNHFHCTVDLGRNTMKQTDEQPYYLVNRQKNP